VSGREKSLIGMAEKPESALVKLRSPTCPIFARPHRYLFSQVAFAGSRPLPNRGPDQSAGGSLRLPLPFALAVLGIWSAPRRYQMKRPGNRHLALLLWKLRHAVTMKRLLVLALPAAWAVTSKAVAQ